MRKRETLSRTFTLLNELGLHARPAALLAQLAGRFRSDIVIHKGSKAVNAKSLLGLLTLDAPQGTELRIEASGSDAVEALNALGKLFADRFDED